MNTPMNNAPRSCVVEEIEHLLGVDVARGLRENLCVWAVSGRVGETEYVVSHEIQLERLIVWAVTSVGERDHVVVDENLLETAVV